jgi:hypothetical protein
LNFRMLILVVMHSTASISLPSSYTLFSVPNR